MERKVWCLTGRYTLRWWAPAGLLSGSTKIVRTDLKALRSRGTIVASVELKEGYNKGCLSFLSRNKSGFDYTSLRRPRSSTLWRKQPISANRVPAESSILMVVPALAQGQVRAADVYHVVQVVAPPTGHSGNSPRAAVCRARTVVKYASYVEVQDYKC